MHLFIKDDTSPKHSDLFSTMLLQVDIFWPNLSVLFCFFPLQKLMELGVQRLILPAVPGVLNTWTGSFGFSKMTDSERLQFVDCTFLDFQDTIICQKLLMKLPSAQSSPLKGLLNIARLLCLRTSEKEYLFINHHTCSCIL
jgi:hypothetical protein